MLLSAKTAPAPERSKVQDCVNLVWKAIPVAMGVAVAVTSVLGEVDIKSGFTMVGIGLASVGISLLSSKN